MNDCSFNGWTNYETWNAALHIDNDQGEQEYWLERAKDAIESATDSDDEDKDIDSSDAVYQLAQELQQSHEERIDELDLSGVLRDLLTSAVGAINWRELATNYVSHVVEARDFDARR